MKNGLYFNDAGEPVLAVVDDPVDSLEPLEDPGTAQHAEASEVLRAINSACVDGIERVRPEGRAQAVGLRLLALLCRLGTQPLGCNNQAELARKLGVSRNGISEAAARAFEGIEAPPRDR